MKRDVNDILLGHEGAPVEHPPANPLQAIAIAATRIAVSLEASKSDATVGARMVQALESLARDVAALRQTSERERSRG